MYNRVVVAGRLTADPELGQSGESQFCNFRVAFDGPNWDKEAKKPIAEFMRVTVWSRNGRKAESCFENLKKGSPVVVEGKITTRKWTKDGVDHYTTEIIADDVRFLPSGEKEIRAF